MKDGVVPKKVAAKATAMPWIHMKAPYVGTGLHQVSAFVLDVISPIFPTA